MTKRVCIVYVIEHKYLITFGTHVMLASFEVKGDATLASVSERDMPAWAAFNAWEEEMQPQDKVIDTQIVDVGSTVGCTVFLFPLNTLSCGLTGAYTVRCI